MQSESEQRPHKLSYHLSAKGAEGEAVVKQLEEKLAAAGVSAKARSVLKQQISASHKNVHMHVAQNGMPSVSPARLTLIDNARF